MVKRLLPLAAPIVVLPATPPLTVQEVIHSTGNPILAGRDEAPPGVNDFILNEWQLLAATGP